MYEGKKLIYLHRGIGTPDQKRTTVVFVSFHNFVEVDIGTELLEFVNSSQTKSTKPRHASTGQCTCKPTCMYMYAHVCT
jgi:hypothetical protein